MSSRFIAAALLLAPSILHAQNASVQNAATAESTAIFGNPFAIAPTSGANIVAPGMLATLSYSQVEVVNGAVVGPSLPATVSIRPSGSDAPIRVEVSSFAPYSVTFAIPRNIPLGGAEVEYKVEGQPTQWTNVNVVATSFDFFRIGQGGPPIAQSVAANGSLSPIGLTTPAQPGQTIRLTGTGLGNATPVSLTLGGVPATPVKAQPHRSQLGIDEILFEMPAAVPDGCYVPLVLTFNQAPTVTSTISKTSNAAPCVHPYQLSVADMTTLDNGGFLMTAEIEMLTDLEVATATAASRIEDANVELTPMTAAQIASQFAPNPLGTVSGCSVNQLQRTYGLTYEIGNFTVQSPLPAIPDLGTMSLQNAATTLSLTGSPGYLSATIPQSTQGPLSNPPAPVIAGGNWTWQSGGGGDLAASSFTFALPAPFQLNGSAPPSIVRNQDQTLTWNGGFYGSGTALNISLTPVLPANGVAVLNCSVPANIGTLTIPAGLLGQLASGYLGTLSIGISQPGAGKPHTQFKLKNGSTLLMFVNYSSSESLPVDVQ